jgi:hypothetical protein
VGGLCCGGRGCVEVGWGGAGLGPGEQSECGLGLFAKPTPAPAGPEPPTPPSGARLQVCQGLHVADQKVRGERAAAGRVGGLGERAAVLVAWRRLDGLRRRRARGQGPRRGGRVGRPHKLRPVPLDTPTTAANAWRPAAPLPRCPAPQRATAARRDCGAHLAVVREERPPAAARHAEPGAAPHRVPAGQYVGIVHPKVGGVGWPARRQVWVRPSSTSGVGH